MNGTLYLIPAPLGEAGDLPAILPEQVRLIALSLDTFVAENAKTARHVLKRYGITRALQEIAIATLDQHTPPEKIKELLAPLLAGKDLGLMSEAGCPAVADPGAQLVRLAHEKGIRVAPLVGPSSLLLALMGSGLNGQSFVFHGYLPANHEARVKKLAEIEKESRTRRQTQLFIEAPYRNQPMLADILTACRPDTLLCLATDLTQAGESIVTRQVAAWKKNPPEIHKKPTIFLLYAG
ncbi:MAG: SAM-dependent methyltransferase [Sulfuricellaceae bacterium]